MPYPYRRTRRYRRRRRRPSARPWYARKYSVSQLASKAWRTAKYIKGMVNCEVKKYDTTATINPANAGASSLHMTALSQGDDYASRDGNSVLLKNLTIRSTYTLNASASSTQITCVVLRDKQQVGDTTPAWSDIFNNTDPRAFLHASTVGRFEVLGRRLITLSSSGVTTKCDQIYIKLNKHCRFNGSASTDIQKGGVYVFWISNESVYMPQVEYHARLTFYDN